MAKQNVWLSVSDLMTGLMIIFLFISIAYISKVQDNQEVLSDYVETKTKLHDKLVDKFKSDTIKWQMSIGRDLSMKFKNPTVLFESGKAELTPDFKSILDQFLPKYFSILVNDSLRDQIEEVRIEGHTDIVPYPQLDPDPYIANAILSQQRALNVLRYFRQMPAYKSFSQEDKKRIEFWLTANGLSYGKSLDSQGRFTFESNKEPNFAMSRRVEFRIITRGDQVLENFVNKNK
ncbi:OmpA family protein [uncultured Prevotella sp.]|uniref:OmpA/MotB family protein n=1 Tax=uncultured Prevotella sp. TaxID=159272 RepID=UPI00259A434E|nr:OmpA family protein [uncultured Prevotella sp.]